MSSKEAPHRARRFLRPLVLVPLLLATLLTAAAVLFWFGGPERPATAATTVPDATADADDGETVPIPSGVMSGGSGEAPEGGVEMPLIPIPGCRCHSDDPAVVEEHAQFTLADCADCH